jgi:adenylate kinase family enzyme
MMIKPTSGKQPMRIVIFGTSGSGKTTLARRLSQQLVLPLIEMDRINWQPGWRALTVDDSAEFKRRVGGAIADPAWVCDGSYGMVRAMVWARATHLVWLDYSRNVIMFRVIRRSVRRALNRRELWPGTGNRERWTDWFRASHPIRWAWSTWKRRRDEAEARLRDPTYAHLVVCRLRRPTEVASVLQRLGIGSEDLTA